MPLPAVIKCSESNDLQNLWRHREGEGRARRRGGRVSVIVRLEKDEERWKRKKDEGKER